MNGFQRSSMAAGLACALLLSACGGDNDTRTTSPQSNASAALAQIAGAPLATNQTAIDGLNWINFRRTQIGLPALARNVSIDRAAQGHSDYQKNNNKVTHDQVSGAAGFTGAQLIDRLNEAGYVFAPTERAYGEVISATSNASGFYMAEELITAIYHRFVMFEPKFKEIGTGAAANASGYIYFTSNFTANNGYGPGMGSGKIATWPGDGQTGVTPNFFSNYEEPDPVENLNEVGYPISVHADLDAALTVESFTVRPRGGAPLAVKLLKLGVDSHTPKSAAAIIPLGVLAARTVYDVRFSGTIDNTPITKNWSFTSK
ncbi:CAP domain-containing protein [Massilia atriviolacea]|uniref:CAP domain-containing protein n=1 Tax=Massilia atriviolacea TaxID=2495579 RepID=A0A430HKS6_9BURK|nr:CAP domain-containing protein [Massilia atriviolacea]RSZ58114.1 CAP domain-containing protein [Massilia atriviolacea]